MPSCRIVYAREILEPDEELPEGVSEYIGVVVCQNGCPELERRRKRALRVARERGWLLDEGWSWE